MYSDGFVSTSFWAVVFCGMAVVVSPVTGIVCGVIIYTLLGPSFQQMDKKDHIEYRIHNGYSD
jgi:hypothetical protein